MRYVTSRQSSWQRHPPVSLLSQGSSHFMMRCSSCDLPTGRTKQDWMREQATFGAKDRRPFSTLGFSTRSPPPTAKRTSSLSTECTNWKRNRSMLRGYEKLSVEPSPPWFLRPLEVWPESVPSISRELLTSFPTGKRCHSRKSSI